MRQAIGMSLLLPAGVVLFFVASSLNDPDEPSAWETLALAGLLLGAVGLFGLLRLAWSLMRD